MQCFTSLDPCCISCQRGIDATKAFCHLAYTHILWEVFEQHDDFKYSVRYLRGQSLEAFDVARSNFTVLLVHALAVRALLEYNDAIHHQNIEEVSVLYRELFISDTLEGHAMSAIKNLTIIVIRFIGFRIQLSELVTESLRDADIRLPGSHEVTLALSWCLSERFIEGHSNEDYDDQP